MRGGGRGGGPEESVEGNDAPNTMGDVEQAPPGQDLNQPDEPNEPDS